ncbi:hypothetical protein N8927_05865 [Crocinitomicaceae bacterium]|nr:hypothetical protein [Crocinitomicaceae bacterium]
MKNLLYLLFVLPLLFSCGDASGDNSEVKKENKKDMSKVTLKGGDDKDYTVNVSILNEVKDIITYEMLQKVAADANRYAKYNVKHSRTYKPNTAKEIMIYGENDTLTFNMKIIAANAYGVEGDLNCYYQFDSKGNELEGESMVFE